MHDGGDYYDSSYNGAAREGGVCKSDLSSTYPMKRPPTPPRPSWFGIAHPQHEPIRKIDDNDSLSEFVPTVLKHFPDYDLTYCFREQKFNNPKTQDMFSTWKLARHYHG